MTTALDDMRLINPGPREIRSFEDARHLADAVDRAIKQLNKLLVEVQDHEDRITALE